MGIGIGISPVLGSSFGAGGSGVAPPDAPSGLTAVQDGADVDLAWTNNAVGDGIKVYRSDDDVTFAQIDDIAAGSTTYTDTTVNLVGTYYYYVAAYNTIGESDSNVDSVTLVFMDIFDRADGALGAPWQGGSTFAIAGNTAVNTPVTVGSNILLNGDFESWVAANDAASWSEFTAGTSTFNQEATDPHGGTYAARMDIDGSGSRTEFSQVPVRTQGRWYRFDGWFKGDTTIPRLTPDSQLPTTLLASIAGTAWINLRSAFLQRTTGNFLAAQSFGNANKSITVDDMSVNLLTTTELFAYLDAGESDVTIKADWTYSDGYNVSPAGVLLNIDNPVNPQNYVACFLLNNMSNIWLVKVVAGVPQTFVANISATYVAGATLEVRKLGDNYKVFYNGVQVGVAGGYTISDAGIIDNTNHGLFSTRKGVSCDFFTLAAA